MEKVYVVDNSPSDTLKNVVVSKFLNQSISLDMEM